MMCDSLISQYRITANVYTSLLLRVIAEKEVQSENCWILSISGYAMSSLEYCSVVSNWFILSRNTQQLLSNLSAPVTKLSYYTLKFAADQ